MCITVEMSVEERFIKGTIRERARKFLARVEECFLEEEILTLRLERLVSSPADKRAKDILSREAAYLWTK